MGSDRIVDAVILAAGNGSRLTSHMTAPKPLVPVAGKPLLEYLLGWLSRAGIERVFVVLGYRSAEIQSHPLKTQGAQIHWVQNPHFEMGNGMSLLAVEGRICSPFLLLMADHLFEVSTVVELLDRPLNGAEGVLATDAKIRETFDLADATKVHSEAGRIRAIGKELTQYDCIDTGMFVL